MKYLSDEENEKFIGDGSLNNKGQDLKSFLDAYDPFRYQNPCNTVDLAVFGYSKKDGSFCIDGILLVKRKNHPCIGNWALPGGFVEYREDIEAAALRELEEETGVRGVLPVQIHSYGEHDRDPRARLITTLYASMLPIEKILPKAGDDAAEAALFSIHESVELEKAGDGGCTHIERHPDTTVRYKDHYLTLACRGKTEELSAIVREIEQTDGVVKKSTFRVMSSNGIAMDHAALILESYLSMNDSFCI